MSLWRPELNEFEQAAVLRDKLEELVAKQNAVVDTTTDALLDAMADVLTRVLREALRPED